MKITRTIFLSLGSNQGNSHDNIQNAIDQIADDIGKITRVSSVYKTKAWGFKGDDFLNVCLEISTNLNPEHLWMKIVEIEMSLGRQRTNDKDYQPRTIDIDVLLFDDEIIFSKELIVPHSKMLERKFVMVPLAEIAPNFKHPIEKKSLLSCLQSCTDESDVVKTDLKLIKPLSLDEKYNYIAIEGNIGAGKTTLSNMIGDEFNARLVLERFADNPFLPKFYEDKDRYAFPLEMSFLADRYQQLSDDLAQFDLF
ncbi:MAG: 2-amino-4-hydroxy-6-hydroxymethyldihydropteridine diphosphokinase, partial [Flavobacteriaceae bacterium]